MPWTKNDYPVSMKNLPEETRHKAVEIANALLEDGYEEGRAIPIATATAKKWADNRDIEEDETRGSLHIVPHPNGWAIRRTNAERASFVLDTKREAQAKAKEMARDNNLEVVVHDDEDGMKR